MKMSSIRKIAVGDLEHELALARTVLERVPADRFDWRPHDKSWTLGELAGHIANLPSWQIGTLQTDWFDMEETIPKRIPPTDQEEVLAEFDRNAESLRDALEQTSDDVLQEPWSLRRGEHVIWSKPKWEVLREWGISHLIHHRGQLTVYLRLLDISLPPIYGPSGDEAPSG